MKRNQLLLLAGGGALVLAVALWLLGRRAGPQAAPATPQLAPPLVSVVPYASPAQPRAASSVSSQQVGATWAGLNAVLQSPGPPAGPLPGAPFGSTWQSWGQ